MVAVIPCCGLGTRMRMPKNKSKELLINPKTKEPLIKWHLDRCLEAGIRPLVLLRKEKKDLIKYCNVNHISYLTMDPGKEWAETVYNSNEFWKEDNVLLFPDSVYNPINTLKHIKFGLESDSDACLGIFKVKSGKKWCILTDKGIYEKNPKMAGAKAAIGVFGFKKAFGLKLFKALAKNGFYKYGASKISFRTLESFKDLTRTGKIG